MEADVWSCGVVLFALLTGRLPFDDDNLQLLLKKVKAGMYQMPSFLTDDVRDLIGRMLCMDPEKRIKIKEIKRHVWWRTMEKKLLENSVSNLSIPDDKQPKSDQNADESATNVESNIQEEEEETNVAPPQPIDSEDMIDLSGVNSPDDDDDDDDELAVQRSYPRDQVDTELIKAMENLGFTDSEELYEALASEENNPETVAYNLLLRQKRENGSIDSVESFAPKLAVTPTNPITDGVDKGELLRKKLQEATEKFQETKKSEDSSSSAQNEKDRKSWFSFWRRKKPAKHDEDSTSQFGLHSSKSQKEILDELERSFQALQIHWTLISDSIVQAKCAIGDILVVFDITINTLPSKEGYLLNFARQAGEVYHARVIFDTLSDELNI
jgi:serine/threonine protein kinase